jgi:hypothetical protein
MKTVDTHGTFEEAISRSESQMAEIARQLRKLIIDVDPDVVEVPWPHQQIIGYGVGPKKMSEHYCYIAPQRDYANLGFYYGASLPDPDGLLEGTGRNMRHVKVREESEIAQPALRKLVELAFEERRRTLGIEE